VAYNPLGFIKTLFLQPTWSCAKNCRGCYVKEKEKKFGSEQLSHMTWQLLLSDIFQEQKMNLDQVTMAVDTLPINNKKTHHSMVSTFINYCIGAFQHKDKTKERHLTINCISDLKEYINQFDIYAQLFLRPSWYPKHAGEAISMISISNINSPDDVKHIREQFPGTKINWNILSTALINMSNEKIISILQNVDQAYLLLHKAPLGKHGHDFSAMKQAMNKVRILSNHIESLT